MRTPLLAAAAAAIAGLASPAAAQGYGYYGYGPTPAYAAYGEDYAPYADEGGCGGGGFTLAGARAGITVLGVNLDAGSGLRISAGDGRCHHRQRRVEARADYAPPPPPPPPPSYETYEEPAYVTSYPTMTYAAPCGCEPAYRW